GRGGTRARGQGPTRGEKGEEQGEKEKSGKSRPRPPCPLWPGPSVSPFPPRRSGTPHHRRTPPDLPAPASPTSAASTVRAGRAWTPTSRISIPAVARPTSQRRGPPPCTGAAPATAG